MSARTVIDSLEFARAGQALQGSIPVASLARLEDCLYDPAGNLQFAVTGGRDDERRLVLLLNVSGVLHLQCQRCLGQLVYPLQLSTTLRLVRPGANLKEMDADPEAPDCVEAGTELDVVNLIEDEILLSLPLSPRHAEGACARQLPQAGHAGHQANGLGKLAELKKIWESKH
jgi:DUF177 domain-containing protein